MLIASAHYNENVLMNKNGASADNSIELSA